MEVRDGRRPGRLRGARAPPSTTPARLPRRRARPRPLGSRHHATASRPERHRLRRPARVSHGAPAAMARPRASGVPAGDGHAARRCSARKAVAPWHALRRRQERPGRRPAALWRAAGRRRRCPGSRRVADAEGAPVALAGQSRPAGTSGSGAGRRGRAQRPGGADGAGLGSGARARPGQPAARTDTAGARDGPPRTGQAGPHGRRRAPSGHQRRARAPAGRSGGPDGARSPC